MKYIVLKELPRASVGDILETNNNFGSSPNCLAVKKGATTSPVLTQALIIDALDQGFIEPYEEKPKKSVEVRSGNSHYTAIICEADYEMSQDVENAITKAIKLLFEYLYLSEDPKNEWGRMDDAIGKARKLVLETEEVPDE